MGVSGTYINTHGGGGSRTWFVKIMMVKSKL